MPPPPIITKVKRLWTTGWLNKLPGGFTVPLVSVARVIFLQLYPTIAIVKFYSTEVFIKLCFTEKTDTYLFC